MVAAMGFSLILSYIQDIVFVYIDQGFFEGSMVALHGFIKKTRATPDEDLALARKRQRELKP
jgi:phage-related protein